MRPASGNQPAATLPKPRLAQHMVVGALRSRMHLARRRRWRSAAAAGTSPSGLAGRTSLRPAIAPRRDWPRASQLIAYSRPLAQVGKSFRQCHLSSPHSVWRPAWLPATAAANHLGAVNHDRRHNRHTVLTSAVPGRSECSRLRGACRLAVSNAARSTSILVRPLTERPGTPEISLKRS
jgi:hypothetical protein